MHYLSQWQSITPISLHGPVIDPPIYIELNEDQMIPLEILRNQTLTDELK